MEQTANQFQHHRVVILENIVKIREVTYSNVFHNKKQIRHALHQWCVYQISVLNIKRFKMSAMNVFQTHQHLQQHMGVKDPLTASMEWNIATSTHFNVKWKKPKDSHHANRMISCAILVYVQMTPTIHMIHVSNAFQIQIVIKDLVVRIMTAFLQSCQTEQAVA